MEHTPQEHLTICEDTLVTLIASGLQQDLFMKETIVRFMDNLIAISKDIDSLSLRETTAGVIMSELLMKAVNLHTGVDNA
jgi:hypothetical protein